MKDLLAPIIEDYVIIHDSTNDEYLDAIYNSSDYTNMGILLLVITFMLLLTYYKLIDPVLPRITHWLLAVFISLISVAIVCFSLLFTGSMEPFILDYIPDESNSLMDPTLLSWEVALVMMTLSIIPLVAFTILLRFISVNNKRNPF
jgi:hypothetical protein